MGDLLKIAVSAALINNVVLSQFFGLCPFLGVSKKTKTAAGMGAAVVFVMTIASALSYVVPLPEPPPTSLLIPFLRVSAPALSTLSHASNLDW